MGNTRLVSRDLDEEGRGFARTQARGCAKRPCRAIRSLNSVIGSPGDVLGQSPVELPPQAEPIHAGAPSPKGTLSPRHIRILDRFVALPTSLDPS